MAQGTNRRYYRGRAKEWVLGVTSNGTPQIAVLFEVLTEGATHQQLTWYGYFTDNAWERTVESLQHMGWEGEDPSELENSGGNLNKNEVDLVVEDEEYEGKTRAKVQFVNKPRALAVKAPLQGDQLKSFSEQMKAKIRAKKAAGGQKVAAPKPPSAGQAEAFSDDIPF